MTIAYDPVSMAAAPAVGRVVPPGLQGRQQVTRGGPSFDEALEDATTAAGPPAAERADGRQAARGADRMPAGEPVASDDDDADGTGKNADDENAAVDGVSAVVPVTVTVVTPVAIVGVGPGERSSRIDEPESATASSVEPQAIGQAAVPDYPVSAGDTLPVPIPVAAAASGTSMPTEQSAVPTIDASASPTPGDATVALGESRSKVAEIGRPKHRVEHPEAAAPGDSVETRAEARAVIEDAAEQISDRVAEPQRPTDSRQPADVVPGGSAPQKHAGTRPPTGDSAAAAARRDAQAMIAAVLEPPAHSEKSSTTEESPRAIHARRESVVVSPGATSLQDAAMEVHCADPSAEVEPSATLADASSGAPHDSRATSDHAGQQHADTQRPATLGREHSAPPASAALPPPAFAKYLESAPIVGGPLTPSAATAWHVPEQIIRQMQLQWNDGSGRATLRLNPEHLGEVVVEMRVENGGVTATLRAETPAVRAWIESHRQELATGLADSGLRLDELRVDARDDAREGRREPPGEAPRRRARRQPMANGMRFEVHA